MATKKTAAAKIEATLEDATAEGLGGTDPVPNLEEINSRLATLDHRIDQVVEVLRSLRSDVEHVRGRLNV